MKNLIYLTLILGLVGCASTKKPAQAPPESPSQEVSVAEPSAHLAESQSPGKSKKVAKKKALEPSPDGVGGKSLDCINGTDKRVLEIKQTDRKGCELHYTKSDGTQTIATQVIGSDKCVEVQERIKGKLEASGYKCS